MLDKAVNSGPKGQFQPSLDAFIIDRPRQQANDMPKVVIYTTLMCPYCLRAKQLLQRKGVDYEEIRIDEDHQQVRIMMARSHRKTVPQIFIDDFHVGGYDDLAALDACGELDPRLGR